MTSLKIMKIDILSLIINALENALDQWNRKKIAKSNYTLGLCYSGA